MLPWLFLLRTQVPLAGNVYTRGDRAVLQNGRCPPRLFTAAALSRELFSLLI